MSGEWWTVQCARCDDRGGLMIDGVDADGREFAQTITHAGPVDPRYDFTGCYFGAGAADRLEELQAP